MARRVGLLAALPLMFVLAATPATAQGPASAAPAGHSPKTVMGSTGAWTTYHHDNAHTGYDPSAPTLGTVQVTPGWVNTTLDGEIYAEPLIFNGVVYAATLNNTVYALNQATGAVVWSKNVGAPQTGGWVCGNVSPTGILGTPVIDTAANRIYAVAEIAGTTPTYHLFGLDLAASGGVVLDVPLAPTGFDWKIQQQRGALAIANGFVYVPFGGRAGDCFDSGTPYYGWVLGVPTAGGTTNVFQTPSGAESVWAAGGVVFDDTSHNVFFATGNAIPCSGAMMSDAVVRVSPTLTTPTFFEPNDWQANWCSPDSDLGSASPVLLSPTLMFQAGKHGGGFLLDPTNLGGINGQLYPPRTPYAQADVCLGSHSDATFASFAYAAPFVYLECETPSGGLGLVALNVNTAAPSFTNCGASCPAPDWHAGGSTRFGPPIVAAGAVWVASNSGLTAFNATTGAMIYQSSPFGINRFVTPAEAGGQVFVPSHTVVRSFSFTNSVTFTPASLSFGGQAPTTTSAAQAVTLHNNQSVVLSVTAVALTGANAADYVKGTDTCTGVPVAANGTCTVMVSFKPGGFGGFPASLTFTDDGPGTPQSVSLNGMGALDNQGHLYTLDGFGGIHADGSASAMMASAYWPGWNIARSLALFPDGSGGYTLDGYGGLHPFGSAPALSGYAYFGFDIARQVVLAPWSSAASPAGWTLDGYGGPHAFGGAPVLSGYPYWGGWDIARGLAILPDSTPSSVAGYTLDGFGGVHAFGGAPAPTGFTYWGWDIARGITLAPSASRTNPAGYTLDGYGGLHAFGNAPAPTGYAYFGWDIARGVVAWTGNGNGGWTLDGWGGIHPFGSAPGISSFPYWPGWDIATSLGGPNSGSACRRRT